MLPPPREAMLVDAQVERLKSSDRSLKSIDGAGRVGGCVVGVWVGVWVDARVDARVGARVGMRVANRSVG